MKTEHILNLARGGLGHGAPSKVVVEFKSKYDRQMALVEVHGPRVSLSANQYKFQVCGVDVEFTVMKCPTCGHVE